MHTQRWIIKRISAGLLILLTACAQAINPLYDTELRKPQNFSNRRAPRENNFIAQGGYSKKDPNSPFGSNTKKASDPYYDDSKAATLSDWLHSPKVSNTQDTRRHNTLMAWFQDQMGDNVPNTYMQHNSSTNGTIMHQEGGDIATDVQPITEGNRRLPMGNIEAMRQNGQLAFKTSLLADEGSGMDASYESIMKVQVVPVAIEHMEQEYNIPKSSHISMNKASSKQQHISSEPKGALGRAANTLYKALRQNSLTAVLPIGK